MQEFEEDVRILRLLKPRLPEDQVILDVGASNGRWTREIVKINLPMPKTDRNAFGVLMQS
jgi:precorrin-6B methylase 2